MFIAVNPLFKKNLLDNNYILIFDTKDLSLESVSISELSGVLEIHELDMYLCGERLVGLRPDFSVKFPWGSLSNSVVNARGLDFGEDKWLHIDKFSISTTGNYKFGDYGLNLCLRRTDEDCYRISVNRTPVNLYVDTKYNINLQYVFLYRDLLVSRFVDFSEDDVFSFVTNKNGKLLCAYKNDDNVVYGDNTLKEKISIIFSY